MDLTKKLYHGVAYYPELWPEEDILNEIKKFKHCGINVVRMGEFAWAQMEPNEGEISIDFFINVIDLLHEYGIKTVFCTPTPTPPIWLSHGHPERCHVDQNGKIAIHGGRQHICRNHPYVRERARIITEAIAKAVANHPGLLAWQTDNEFGCDAQENFSKATWARWVEWLKEKYHSIDQLNKKWGTEIWSEKYQSFDQVPQPLNTLAMHNASLLSAYRLFSYDMVDEFQKEQVDIIRKYSDAPITHNGGLDFNANQHTLYQNLDFAACDYYTESQNYDEVILNYEFWRNVLPGKAFWVMETCSGHSGNLHKLSKMHLPGFVKAKAVAAYAMGSESFCYWVWRQQRSGCELSHGGIYSSWGSPAPGYKNLIEVTEAKNQLEPILTTSKLNQPETAILWSEKARVYFKSESLGGLDYHEQLGKWAACLRKNGYALDVIGEHNSLNGYHILYTPFCPYLDESFIEKAKAFVKSGGTWIAGPLTGGRTAEHTVHIDKALGPLEELSGIETVYTYPISNSGTTGECFGKQATLSCWANLFNPQDGICRGMVRNGPTPNLSFLSENKLGDGKIVLLGALPVGDDAECMLSAILNHYATDAGITMKFEASVGTIVVPRRSENCNDLWIIINMDGKGGTVYLPRQGIDKLNQKSTSIGAMAIDPYDYRVIEFT